MNDNEVVSKKKEVVSKKPLEQMKKVPQPEREREEYPYSEYPYSAMGLAQIFAKRHRVA